MKVLRILLSASLIPLAACAAPTPPPPPEDQAFTHALTLVQTFVHAATQSDDPQASLKAIDDVLAGRNPEANRALSGLLDEATADMSAQNKEQIASIGRDLAAAARREGARVPSTAPSADRALQARKDLASMGLRYYDTEQFLDAVRRNDALAVQLYVEGAGVNVSAKGADGRTALDIARANGNDSLVALLSRNLPAAR